jgi:hypothetical protein
VIDSGRVRMCLHHILKRHVLSSLGYCMSGEGGMRVSPRTPSTTNASSST